MALLSVRGLRIAFTRGDRQVLVADGVDFDIFAGRGRWPDR